VRHGQPPYRIEGVLVLGARRLEELEPRRRGEEEVAHLDPRARRMGAGLGPLDRARLDRQAPGAVGIGGPAGEGETADGADRGQRLAAEAQGVDAQQIVVGELGGGVAHHREFELVRAHTQAVVAHRDEVPAAGQGGHLDAAGAGVEGVLHQLLDRRGGPFDHLAGGDAVDGRFRKDADGHRPSPSMRYCRARRLPSSTAG
jgi:hypothetical protein